MSLTAAGRLNVARRGVARPGFSDLYHRLVTASWPRLLVLLAVTYLGVNALFALAYVEVGGITNAAPGSFADAFFFSVQTIATIGYGVMAPHSLAAHLIVIAEVFVGLVGLAVVTGITFSKFARPTARVRFSRNLVVGRRDGATALMFRMANERGSTLVEATAHVSLIRSEQTVEGETVRRFLDLPLTRQTNLIFALSWSVVHAIDPLSPLFGETAESLQASDAAVVVSVLAIDEVTGQTVHTRHGYNAEDIVWNARFVDILGVGPDGERFIDYRLFDDVVPLG